MKLDIAVYEKLLQVPKGKITTYGDLARSVGLENGQCAIGQIMNRNKFPGIIPCHRVIMSDGKIGGYAYGKKIKANMLRKEGLEVNGQKIINFEEKRYRF